MMQLYSIFNKAPLGIPSTKKRGGPSLPDHPKNTEKKNPLVGSLSLTEFST
jgi:hypothetical protein